MDKNLTQKTWEEFKSTGLFWLINSILHTFGWTIGHYKDENGKLIVTPYRTKFRGFSEKTNTEGYQKITEYLANNISELKDDIKK